MDANEGRGEEPRGATEEREGYREALQVVGQRTCSTCVREEHLIWSGHSATDKQVLSPPSL